MASVAAPGVERWCVDWPFACLLWRNVRLCRTARSRKRVVHVSWVCVRGYVLGYKSLIQSHVGMAFPMASCRHAENVLMLMELS